MALLHAPRGFYIYIYIKSLLIKSVYLLVSCSMDISLSFFSFDKSIDLSFMTLILFIHCKLCRQYRFWHSFGIIMTMSNKRNIQHNWFILSQAFEQTDNDCMHSSANINCFDLNLQYIFMQSLWMFEINSHEMANQR